MRNTVASPSFAKGTLVHTGCGLVPIEQVAEGDLVLSRPEGAGEQGYKRAVRALRHEGVQVVRLHYFREGTPNATSFLDTTLSHLFWVSGSGWTEARLLFSGFGENKRLELQDGNVMIAERVNLVFDSGVPNIGWISHFANEVDQTGYEWDFRAGKLHRSDVLAPEDIRYDDNAPPLKTALYNLEVDNFHTYFVGREGVWVHD